MTISSTKSIYRGIGSWIIRAFNNKAYIEVLALGCTQQELSITRHKHYSSKMTLPCF